MIVVIPAYKPTVKMLHLIEELNEKDDIKILIVNDGSGEKYQLIFDAAKELGCTVIEHLSNKGKGVALKTAFSYIQDHFPYEKAMVCADCDGQHKPEDIIRVGEAISSHIDKLILGCRQFVGQVPWKSMLGNKLTKTIFSFVTGYKIDDTQTGLRGFSSAMISWLLEVGGTRYEYEMNQLLEAKEAGYGVHSVAIQTVYENNNEGSHFRPIVDSVKIYLPILKFSLSSISCGVLDFVLFFVLNWLIGNLFVAVVGARIISSFTNYLLNKHLVFKKKRQTTRRSLLRYYGLAAGILVSNYLLIHLFSEQIDFSLFTSKSFTEGILFGISYYVQKRYIF